LIVLANKSEVTYRTPFVDRRDIALLGKAFFKVAKDKTKPFTVTSGDISTTALGTEFTVTSFEHAHKVIVRLYEGKVVVKAVDKANKKLRKDVYLYPGQAFIYGTESSAKVKAFKVANTGGPEQIMSDEQSSENPLIPQSDEGTWYMFNNQSLAQVLDELSQIFNTRILYDPKDVQNIYFTRKYNRTDSLEDILKEIAIINHLKIAKKDSSFIISK
jgi:ferric-dicitrate binding protein FerR (iron transport regulator)